MGETATRSAQLWLDRLDARGAGNMAPRHCRDNLLAAEALLAPCGPGGLHFAEFPLLGEPCFDMTWCVAAVNMREAHGLPSGLEGARLLAADMDSKGIFGVEYDTSEPQLPQAGLYYKGWLSDGTHAVGRLLECVDRPDESLGALRVAANLAQLGYDSSMCGVMAGREGAPVRITAKSIKEFDAASLAMDLSILGFRHLSAATFAQLDQVCASDGHMTPAPTVYLDVMPDGTLGPTLGIELNGVRMCDIGDFPPLRLALGWGLADGRWQVLRDASFNDECAYFLPSTLKFRWRDGDPLPVKLYMKAGW